MSSCPKFCNPGSGVSSYNDDSNSAGMKRGRIGPPRHNFGNPGNVSPSATPDLPKSTGNNARTYPISKIIARYGAGGATGTFNIQGFVNNPSSRLRLKVVVAFEADATTAPDPSFAVIPTWSITAMSKNPESGREVPLQRAYPSPSGTATTMPLPDAYEMDTSASLLRINVTLTDTNFSVAYVAAGAFVNCVLYATWEPNELMTEAERDFLYAQCNISAPTVQYIANTAT